MLEVKQICFQVAGEAPPSGDGPGTSGLGEVGVSDDIVW